MKRSGSVGLGLKRLGSRGHDDTSSVGSGGGGGGGFGPLKRRNSIIKGVKHIGQVPFQFKYEIVIEYIDKLSYAGDVVVVWERGKAVIGTRPFSVSPQSKRANVNEALVRDVTLFKVSADEQIFNDKVYKIAVRARSSKGDTIGKIHLNFADYAGIPSSSRKVAANLSNGAVVVARITATFLGSGRKKGAGTGSSVGGSQAGSETGSMVDGDELADLGDVDDFNDLIDDEDELDEFKPKQENKLPAGRSEDLDALIDNVADKLDLEDAPVETGTQGGRLSHKSRLQRRQSVDYNPVTTSKLQQTEQLQKEIAILRRKLADANKRVKELSTQNSKLMEDLAAEEQYEGLGRTTSGRSRSGGMGSKATIQAIVAENRQLKNKLDEVTEVLDREPEVEEMVRELKEIKMTLAIANLEKDQACLEAAQLKKQMQGLSNAPGAANGTRPATRRGGVFGNYRLW